MGKANVLKAILFLAMLIGPSRTWSENVLNSDSDYSVKIAVTINSNDHLVGKLEYSNHKPQYPLQLVTFAPVGGKIFAEPYLFEVIERTIIQSNMHRIKCKSINDKYGDGSMILGTIDFRDDLKPKVTLVTESGYAYISNITEKGREVHREHIPNVWLGN
jgi:hypothetical protein